MSDNGSFWAELKAILANGFTGQVTLHVQNGSVERWDVTEVRRKRVGDGVDLTEARLLDRKRVRGA